MSKQKKKNKKSNTKKTTQKKDSRLFIIIAVAAVLIIAAAVITTVIVKNNKQPETEITTTAEGTEDKTLPEAVQYSTVTDKGAYELYDGVYLTELNPYTGKYLEDGKDEEVKNIIQATLVNTTDTPYIQGGFTLNLGGTNYTFNFTTLFPNSKMTVLEANKAEYPTDVTVNGSNITNGSFNIYTFTPSVHLETFGISFGDSIVNVENKTDTDLTNVYVYYKNCDSDGVFQGGITYRVKIGDIEAGTSVQAASQHLTQDSTKICFVTWDGMN